MDAIKREVAQLQAAEAAAKAQKKAAKAAKKEAKAARKAEKKAAKVKSRPGHCGRISCMHSRKSLHSSERALPCAHIRVCNLSQRVLRSELCCMQAAPAAAEAPAPAANGHSSGEPARKRARSASPDGHAAAPKEAREARNGHSNGHADVNGHAERRHREDRDREPERRGRGDEGRDTRRERDGGDRHANGHGSRHHHGGSSRHERREAEEGGERARPRAHVFNGASAQAADLKYGLNFGGAAPEGVHTHDRRARCDACSSPSSPSTSVLVAPALASLGDTKLTPSIASLKDQGEGCAGDASLHADGRQPCRQLLSWRLSYLLDAL